MIYNQGSAVASDLKKIDLSYPALPLLWGDLSIAGQLDHMWVYQDRLWAFGKAVLDQLLLQRVSLFSLEGVELDSELLGTDLSSTLSLASEDDQRFYFDSNYLNLFLPLVSSGFVPGEGYQMKYRLAITKGSNTELLESQLINLKEGAERIMAMEENLALSFSASTIYQLHNGVNWESDELWSVNLPSQAYHVPESDIWVVQSQDLDTYKLRSVKGLDIFGASALDEIEIVVPASEVCQSPYFYYGDHFGKNVILWLAELPNLFVHREDCPFPLSVEQLDLKGWSVDSLGQFQELDQETLVSFYTSIRERTVCITDPENLLGEPIDSLEVLPETAQCFSGNEFYQLTHP